MKSEPGRYGRRDLVRDGGSIWGGVRNHAATAHLRAMQVGDRVLVHHSGGERAAVGIATVTGSPRKDGDEGRWVAVPVTPDRPLARPVTLAAMKADPALAGLPMLRRPRLSVSPVADDE